MGIDYNREEAVKLLQDLVKLETVTNLHNEKILVPVILDFLKNTSFELSSLDVASNRKNIKLSVGNDKGKHLVFNGHFDTVPIGNEPWEIDPYSAEIVDGKLYGRGATDMKSGLAAMLVAFKKIANEAKFNGKLSFVGTVGEEVDCIGAKQVTENNWFDSVTTCIIAEPTINKICIAHKGVIWLKITTKGKTAHGSMPHLGVNAIESMTEIIRAIQQYQFEYNEHYLLGKPTINFGTIQGGVGTNVVPDQCTLTVDIRTVPGQKHSIIIKDIEQIITNLQQNKNWQFTIEPINDLQSVNTSEQTETIELAKQLSIKKDIIGVNYYTDGAVFQKRHPNLPILIYGPGTPELAHQPNEFVELNEFYEAIEFYYNYAKKYLL